MKASNMAIAKGHHTLLYGAPKSGKSAAALLLAAHYNILHIDGEGSAKVLANKSLGFTPQLLEKIEVLSVTDTPSSPAFAQLVPEVLKFGKLKYCTTHGKKVCGECMRLARPFDEFDMTVLDDTWIIVFDSLTQIGNSVMNLIKLARGVLPTELNTEKATFNDYGQQGMWLDNQLSLIQTCPFNVIVVSHELGIENTEGKEQIMAVCGTKNFSRNVGRYFDSVVRMEVSMKGHSGISTTTAKANVNAGTRTGIDIREAKGTGNESILRSIYSGGF